MNSVRVVVFGIFDENSILLGSPSRTIKQLGEIL